MEGETTYTVEEAATLLGETPERVLEMLATGDLNGMPPGATLSGEWKVLLPRRLEEEHGQEAPVEASSEEPPVDQEDAPTGDEEPEQPVAPPHSTDDAAVVSPATEDLSRGDNAAIAQEPTAPSGWVSTQQAAKALGISPRTVRWHIEQGNLQAKPEGERGKTLMARLH